MNGSAIVFEVLREIDTKYTKFTDKEYDTISSEVKKWFKELVVSQFLYLGLIAVSLSSIQKEEKAHDQKIEKANTRIKQAGQQRTVKPHLS